MKRYLFLPFFYTILSISGTCAATGSLQEEVGPKDAEWLKLYNEYKANFRCEAKKDILAIENAVAGEVSRTRFMSADAKLHDVRGAASKVVVYHIETDSLYNYDLDEFDEKVVKYGFDYVSQYCVFDDWVELRNFSFNPDGKAVYPPLPGEYDTGVVWTAKRNARGQLVEYALDENFMGEPTIRFSYDNNGMLKSMDYRGMVASKVIYNYDESLNLVSAISKWMGSSETEGTDTMVYKVAKRDRFGNWVKRYIDITKEDRSEGGFSLSREYYVEYRVISYK
ncbi:MAG: hypothetical protein IKP81_00565 [Paludibacteraceae bacterium]|nr:hypothetical protein [Paludibacteraceae bacterium]